MTVYRGSSGHNIVLGKRIGGGGEGAVFGVDGRVDTLAKIYFRSPSVNARAKLTYMVAHPPQDPLRTSLGHVSIAWPEETLHAPSGEMVGFLMPNAPGAYSVLDLYNPHRRAKVAPGFNLRYLYRTGHNLASAADSLHLAGYVIGDVNEANIRVTDTALITLIDCDSMQVIQQLQGKPIVHRCTVGRPEYTPPELQGKRFADVDRTPESDLFGLAVVIFSLVMRGNHPFRSRWLGQGDPPPVEEKIRKGLFAHGKQASSLLAPVPGISLGSLHPELARLFVWCFEEGHHHPSSRPTGREWAKALEVAENDLVTCAKGHYRPSHLTDCPECHSIQAQKLRPPRPSPAPRLPSLFPNPVLPAQGPPLPRRPIPMSPWVRPLLVAAAVFSFFTLGGSLTLPPTSRVAWPSVNSSPVQRLLDVAAFRQTQLLRNTGQNPAWEVARQPSP